MVVILGFRHLRLTNIFEAQKERKKTLTLSLESVPFTPMINLFPSSICGCSFNLVLVDQVYIGATFRVV